MKHNHRTKHDDDQVEPWWHDVPAVIGLVLILTIVVLMVANVCCTETGFPEWLITKAKT